MENLIRELNVAVAEDERRRPDEGPVNEEWLEGTNVLVPQTDASRRKAVIESHHAKQKRRRPKRRTLDTPLQDVLSSPTVSASASCRHKQEVSEMRNTKGRSAVPLPIPVLPPASRRRCTSSRRSPSPSTSLYSSSPGGASMMSTTVTSSAAGSLSSEPFLLSSDSEVDSEEEVDWLESFSIVSSPDELQDSSDGFADTLLDDGLDNRNWFEKSKDDAESGRPGVSTGEEIQLSKKQLKKFGKGNGAFSYPDFITNPKQQLTENPPKYKRCQLRIDSAHRATAKNLDQDSPVSEILISGRSRCGRTYMDDIVVVEILKEPGHKKDLQKQDGSANTNLAVTEGLAYGQVVGLLERIRYPEVDHPVLYCTLDDMEGHLMRPLCKTVPKIHVMNDTVRNQHKDLLKTRIEIKTITPNGDIEHRGFQDVRPSERELYVFKVAILNWRQKSLYPLGAVLDCHMSGRDYASGLKVLLMQQRVPTIYPQEVINNTNDILQGGDLSADGREVLTDRLVFTIDPPGSVDLDDALSVWKEGTHYVVGVHIADVALVVQEGSAVDEEARKRAATFYPRLCKPHRMLPEPIGTEMCSLLPEEERPALSVFYRFNDKLNQVGDPEVKKTVIRSRKQFTYSEVQCVIDGNAPTDLEQGMCDAVLHLHRISAKLGETRKKTCMLFIPFEDPRLVDSLDDDMKSKEAHALVEELMILTNSYIAKRLRSNYEQLAEWRDEEGGVANLVMQLQGKNVTPDTKLSVDATSSGGACQRQTLMIQDNLWKCLCRCLEDGKIEEARKIAFMDDLHPLQCLANSHWMQIMETAQYKCSYGLNQLDHFHFGLDMAHYTHFTSPIRRYADLHIHRLLHADLNGEIPTCTPDDVTNLCREISSAKSRQKVFQKGCRSLKIADSLQRQPLVFRTFVDQVDSEQLTLTVPSLRAVSDRKQELPFSILGVSSQPELTTDTAQKKVTVEVQWKRRIYDVQGLKPRDHVAKREAIERIAGSESSRPLTMNINHNHHSVIVKQKDWMQILKDLTGNRRQKWENTPQPVQERRSGNDPLFDHMTSEKGDGTVSLRPCYFKTQFSPGQVLQIQMSAEPRKGILKPRVDLLHMVRNASFCVQHMENPVTALGYVASKSTGEKTFKRFTDYISAWMPLLEMEAAHGAGNSDGYVTIENVTLTMSPNDVKQRPGRVCYRGTFKLSASFCFDRCINFGGRSPLSTDDDKREPSSKTRYHFPLDYLCIRYVTDLPAATLSRLEQAVVPDSLDKQYTWVGHASIVDVLHKGRKKKDGGDFHVTFVLSHTAPSPPQSLLTKDGDKVTLEILPKDEVERRAQHMLLQLEEEGCEIPRAIAYGSTIPALDDDRMKLGKKAENHELPATQRFIPKNNPAQQQAIRMAMTSSASLIQGPPGTGKTYTGMKLVYLFCKINRQLEKEGKGKKTVLFCGPSNKSVDLVAKVLNQKLGRLCPKMVRMYGSAIESKDYPVPRGNLRSTRGMRADLVCDPELQNVALHHIIRHSDKPYAEQIAAFEKLFQQSPSSVDNNVLQKYYKLLRKASVEELGNYEVVLTTCAVAGSSRLVEGLKGKVFQVMIDECAMSPEPHSLVPIIATKARQVVLIGDHKQLRPIITCQAAAELGLEQSLFERLYDRNDVPRMFLNVQYRMHPQICEFPSQEFYEGKLRTGRFKYREDEQPLPFWPRDLQTNEEVPHILVDVRGEEEAMSVSTDEGNERSKSNVLEAEKVMEILSFFKLFEIELQYIKVLTQYNAQRHLLEQKMKQQAEERTGRFNRYDKDKSKHNASTVVSSQGGEWDYVILSTVRSLPSYKIEPHPTHGWCRQNLGFITDKNQVNVALTRAKKGIIIVGNMELLRCDEVWRHLVDRYEAMGCVRDAAQFPPPLPPRKRRPRHANQPGAAGEWQKV
ncbi:hypothetical protein BaRGS_00026075 [Batillaria attramentaria]|uniref:RNB domain-containing protein n=1 Tax=Batillaria attramentaria TaxID=370345 RepID=A0ABD0K6S9_9CAEN